MAAAGCKSYEDDVPAIIAKMIKKNVHCSTVDVGKNRKALEKKVLRKQKLSKSWKVNYSI